MYVTDPKAPPRAGTFELPPLPYAYDALEPVISRRTVELHYDKHHRDYIDKLNQLIEETELAHVALDEVVRRSVRMPGKQQIFNNAGQAWNHHFYWRSLTPDGGRPSAAMKQRLERDFGSYEKFAESFVKTCMEQFGTGWAWLVVEANTLKLTHTADADTPIAHGMTPLLTIDVWEHAYYLDYQNRRQEYAKKVVEKLLNWQFVEQNLGGTL